MNNRHNRLRARNGVRAILAMSAAAGVLAACGGSGIEGHYPGVEGESLLTSITLKSGGKADFVYPLGLGNSGEGSYLVEGETVTLTAPSGDKAQMALDARGCLTNPIVGDYCKNGSAAPSGTSAAPAATSAGAEVYQATTGEGRIVLELNAGGSAHMTMEPLGGGGNGVPQRMTFDLAYERSGNGISIEFPGEGPTELVRSGADLTMTANGETVRFVRQ
jgi:hypothetical protein